MVFMLSFVVVVVVVVLWSGKHALVRVTLVKLMLRAAVVQSRSKCPADLVDMRLSCCFQCAGLVDYAVKRAAQCLITPLACNWLL